MPTPRNPRKRLAGGASARGKRTPTSSTRRPRLRVSTNGSTSNSKRITTKHAPRRKSSVVKQLAAGQDEQKPAGQKERTPPPELDTVVVNINNEHWIVQYVTHTGIPITAQLGDVTDRLNIQPNNGIIQFTFDPPRAIGFVGTKYETTSSRPFIVLPSRERFLQAVARN